MPIWNDEAHQLPPVIYVRRVDGYDILTGNGLQASTTLTIPHGDWEVGEYKLVEKHRLRNKTVTERLP